MQILAAVPLVVVLGIGASRRGALRNGGRARRLAAAIAIGCIGLVAAFSWSFTGYMTADGSAPLTVRTADWMRDHGLSPVVDQLETHLYGNSEPNNDPVTLDRLPEVITTAATATRSIGGPEPIANLVDDQLDGEGLWTPNARAVDGAAVTYTTFFRPDAAHQNVVAAAVWLNPRATSLVYGSGTKEPGGSGWNWASGIPTSERDGLVAAFNAGFKFKDIDSGLFTEGRTPFPLVGGDASLVIYDDGSADIGAWGTDVTMTDQVMTVRQNLRLVVDNGSPVDGLSSSILGEWGKRRWQLQYTRRSGIGITTEGALVYVAGARMTTESLGQALAQAGSVRAMELDIHNKQPTFNFFDPAPGTSAGVVGTKLLPDMQRDADRYLDADQRDFFAVVLR